MSSSTFKINKICQHCGSIFEAQKTTTKFCSHKCNQHNYKLRTKLAKKEEAERVLPTLVQFKPKVNALDLERVKQKEFLSVTEISVLFGCSRQTVYNIIKAGNIKAVNLLQKKTLIKRTDIDKLFN